MLLANTQVHNIAVGKVVRRRILGASFSAVSSFCSMAVNRCNTRYEDDAHLNNNPVAYFVRSAPIPPSSSRSGSSSIAALLPPACSEQIRVNVGREGERERRSE